jgi:drug/metabolite transporter (DMT)-like permease
LAEGLNRTGAGLGSVIIDSQPLTVALLAALLFGERLSGLGVLGEHSLSFVGAAECTLAQHCCCGGGGGCQGL